MIASIKRSKKTGKTVSELVHEFYEQKPAKRYFYFIFKGGWLKDLIENLTDVIGEEVPEILEGIKAFLYLFAHTVVVIIKITLFPFFITKDYYRIKKQAKEYIEKEGLK
jgi:hypothetical protein